MKTKVKKEQSFLELMTALRPKMEKTQEEAWVLIEKMRRQLAR